MARKKEFDREEVLTKAMYTFLQHGYEGTSMQTLVSTMGINRGSLYDTFGDKHSLFLVAIAVFKYSSIASTFASNKTEPFISIRTGVGTESDVSTISFSS